MESNNPFAAAAAQTAREENSANPLFARRQQEAELRAAIGLVREICKTANLTSASNRGQLAARLLDLAFLCGGFGISKGLTDLPQNPRGQLGVGCGVAIFQAAINNRPAEIIAALERASTFLPSIQAEMLQFLGNVGWLLWHRIHQNPTTSDYYPFDYLAVHFVDIGDPEAQLRPQWLDWSTFNDPQADSVTTEETLAGGMPYTGSIFETTPSEETNPSPTREEIAIAYLIKNPTSSIADVALYVGVNRGTPRRWDKFMTAWTAMQRANQGIIRRGEKDKVTGELIAYSDEE